MIRLCEPEIPKIYWVNCFTYKCKTCGNVFDSVFPNSDDIVKLCETDGDDVRWLPTYGEGGYLDLITKLLPEHSLCDEITMEKARAFIKELNKYCEQGEHGNGFGFSEKQIHECINCNSEDTVIISEKVLTSPKLRWLKISCKLIKDSSSVLQNKGTVQKSQRDR